VAYLWGFTQNVLSSSNFCVAFGVTKKVDIITALYFKIMVFLVR